jgi:hypothetical protein
MSTRFESANSEGAGRDAVAIGAGALTLGGYFYLHSLPGASAFAPIVTVYDGTNFAGFSIVVDSGGHLRILDYGQDAIGAAGATTLSINTWYYLWVRLPDVTFGDVHAYLADSTTEEISDTLIGQGTTARLEFATNQATITATNITGHWYGDLSLDAWKVWTGDLAASSAATEDDAHAISSTTNALAAYFFDGTDVTDHQNTNHLTAIGTLSAGPNSPIDSSGSALVKVRSEAMGLSEMAARILRIQTVLRGNADRARVIRRG